LKVEAELIEAELIAAVRIGLEWVVLAEQVAQVERVERAVEQIEAELAGIE